jgi:spermidine/putrescine transport system permease protein
MKRFFAQTYLWFILILLYAPIIVIAIFSFTEAKTLGNWTGFSFDLYKSLFTSGNQNSLISALKNTMIIALISASVSTVLGTVAAVGIHNLRDKRKKLLMNTLNNLPILNPDIITGVSLFLLFVGLGISQGYTTLILAHISFCTPYVVLSVTPRLLQMNPNLYEAAMDLGATPFQAFKKVILPEIKSGMISGFILALTLSIDDFEVSIFNLGSNGLETLSTFIYADARKGGLTPELRALTTIIFFTVLVLLIIVNIRSRRLSKKAGGN